jgi:MiaB-like tRNA modifying enzyme
MPVRMDIMRAHIKTYGCTLNQADSEAMAAVLEGNGIGLARSQAEADVAVVNTCTVKRQTAQRILDALKPLDRAGKRIVVTGCMASANKDMIEKYVPGASIVTPSNIPRIADAIRGAFSGKRMVLDSYSRLDRLSFFRPASGVVAKVIISEGCTSACSFCETRIARGPLHSFSERYILDAIRCSVANSAKEVQLTSQDVGAYGADTRTNIAELMRKISGIRGDFLVRVGMVNPCHIRGFFDEFVDALRDGHFYKFVHIPVQSGSDSVLESMRRQYSVKEFERCVKDLRSSVPGVAIETDVIVGFPGETEDDFEKSIKLISRVKPEVTNISKFSSRPHTPASRMKQLSNEEISNRGLLMTRAVRAVQRATNLKQVDRRFETLLTEKTPKSLNGRNGSYRQIVIRNEDVQSGMVLGSRYSVRITGASANVLYGSVQ